MLSKRLCILDIISVFNNPFHLLNPSSPNFSFKISSSLCKRTNLIQKKEHMLQKRPHKSSSSYTESIKALEADIQHANSLADALPKDYCGDCVQMRLSYSPLAPFFLYLVEWMDYSCMDALPTFFGLLHVLVYKVYFDGMPTMSSKEKKASLREFYAVIYPSLRQLEGDIMALQGSGMKRGDEKRKLAEKDFERDEECGICMEHCTQMVLPNCVHSMCISCFHDWYEMHPSSSVDRACLVQLKVIPFSGVQFQLLVFEN